MRKFLISARSHGLVPMAVELGHKCCSNQTPTKDFKVKLQSNFWTTLTELSVRCYILYRILTPMIFSDWCNTRFSLCLLVSLLLLCFLSRTRLFLYHFMFSNISILICRFYSYSFNTKSNDSCFPSY